MDKHTKKPAIRFTGFTEAWEQRKLTDVVEFFNGLTYAPNDVQDIGTLVLRSSNVNSGEIIDADNVYVNSSVVQSENVKEGDIIVVVRNGSRALIGKHAQIKRPMPQTVIGAFMTGIRAKCPSFINSLLDTSHFDEEVTINMGATINQITGYMFSKMEFKVPSIEEQKRIGAYFDKLDHLITLHQRKYDKLVNIKKSMLEKMFPKKGSKVPEIRFAGFTEAWEQRKLVSLCEKFTDGDWIEMKDQSDSGFRLIQTGNVGVAVYLDKPNNKKWITEETFNRLHCEEVLPGDILISRLPEPAGRACIIPISSAKMITAVDCTIVRVAPVVSNEFLVQFLSSRPYFNEINTCLAGGTRQRISRSSLANFDVFVPKKKDEQDTIGSFFSKLDHLITLHQRKLEKLKNIKKSMLDKMFVS